MKDQIDKLTVSLKSNPELAEYLSRKGIGEECELKLTASVDEQNEDFAVLSVSAIETEGSEMESESDGEDTEDPEGVEPVMAWASKQASGK